MWQFCYSLFFCGWCGPMPKEPLRKPKPVAELLRQIVEARTRLLERAVHASTTDDEIDQLTINLLEAKVRLAQEDS